MSSHSVFFPIPLDEFGMPQNPINEQPRRKKNPSAQSVHQVLETRELAEKTWG